MVKLAGALRSSEFSSASTLLVFASSNMNDVAWIFGGGKVSGFWATEKPAKTVKRIKATKELRIEALGIFLRVSIAKVAHSNIHKPRELNFAGSFYSQSGRKVAVEVFQPPANLSATKSTGREVAADDSIYSEARISTCPKPRVATNAFRRSMGAPLDRGPICNRYSPLPKSFTTLTAAPDVAANCPSAKRASPS